MMNSDAVPEADALAQSAWLAYVRQELTAPAHALSAYAENLAQAADASSDTETKSTTTKILDRACHLGTLVERLADADPSKNSASRKTQRHDVRGAAAYIIGACEDIAESATSEVLAVVQEPLAATLQAAKSVIVLMEQLVKNEANDPQVQVTDAGLRQMLEQLKARSQHGKQSTTVGHVLLVDDNEFQRDLVSRMLQKLGHTVEVVSSGEEALRRIADVTLPTIEAVLLDVLMPGMSGPEMLIRLKDNTTTRDLPVLMVSALGEDETVLACIAAGAVDYLTRPVKAELLRARLSSSLEQKRLRDRENQYQARIDELVRAIFPSPVIDEWQQTGTIQPRSHDMVGVLFVDVVGFTSFAERYRDDPAKVVVLLQNLIEKFETTAASLGVQKIKTIGDAFMAVVGLAEPVANPARVLLECGLALQADTADHPAGWQIRVGIHVGPVVTGILGKTQFSFDVWGHTVNAASRVESSGQPGKVTLSDEAWQMLGDMAIGEERKASARGLGTVSVWDFQRWL